MNEIWKDIEDYDGYYQVSNLGRVRSLDREVVGAYGAIRKIKGKILTPHPTVGVGQNNRYNQIRIAYNGITTSYFIQRLVAQAFIPNPNPNVYTEVGHKNFDTLDDRVENLFWQDISPMRVKTSTGKYNKTPTQMKSVNKYTLNGQLLKEYISLSDAARDNGSSVVNIMYCCQGKFRQLNGVTYRYARDGFTPCKQNKRHTGIQVRQYSRDNIYIATYNSVKEAAKSTDLDPSSISKCCRNVIKTVGGYVWRYVDE